MPPKRSSIARSSKDFNDQWTAAEVILERVKHSCYRAHMLYKKRYLTARERLTYFDVPIIVFSSVNSVLIAGGRNFLHDAVIEITTCLLALTTGIIQALRTFYKVDENRENCLSTYKDLFRLFCETSIILDQPRSTRGVDPQKFMADKTSEYKEIMNRAIVLEYRKADLDPIYHDQRPWVKSYDMVPEAESPKVASMKDLIPKRHHVDRDVGLPLTSMDTAEMPTMDPVLEEPSDVSDDDTFEDLDLPRGAAGA